MDKKLFVNENKLIYLYNLLAINCLLLRESYPVN